MPLLGDDRRFIRPRRLTLGVPGQQPAEAVITACRFDIEQQQTFAQAQFRTEDRFDAGLLRGLHKFNRTVEVAGVGEGDGGHAVLLRQLHDLRRREHGIQKRVMALHAQRRVILRHRSSRRTDNASGRLQEQCRCVPCRVAQPEVMPA